MMLFFALHMLTSGRVNAQSSELEVDNLERKFKDKAISKEEFLKLSNEWGKILKEFNGYPALPYDSAFQKIRYQYVQNSPYAKEATFKRIIEWAAIAFGELSSVLHYRDLATGKLIIKGFFDVAAREKRPCLFCDDDRWVTLKCYQTLIFTIKDEAFKIDVSNVRYEREGYGAYGSYTITTPLSDLYPITNSDPENWKKYLDLMVNTTQRLDQLARTVAAYVADKDADYDF